MVSMGINIFARCGDGDIGLRRVTRMGLYKNG